MLSSVLSKINQIDLPETENCKILASLIDTLGERYENYPV
jgi:hypothetical protein